MHFQCNLLSLVAKMLVPADCTPKVQLISTFKSLILKRLTCRRDDLLLHNQKLCANVTIIKFKLVWERKCVIIKLKIQVSYSKWFIQHETHLEFKLYLNPLQIENSFCENLCSIILDI